MSLYCTQLVSRSETAHQEEEQQFGSFEPDQSVFQFQSQMVKASFQEQEPEEEETEVFKRPADMTMPREVDKSIVVISSDDDSTNGPIKRAVSEILIDDSSNSNSKDVTITQAKLSSLFVRAESKEVVYELLDSDSNHSSQYPSAKAAALIVDETKLSSSREEEKDDDHEEEIDLLPDLDEANEEVADDQDDVVIDDEEDILNANVNFDSFESKSGDQADQSCIQEMDDPGPMPEELPNSQSLLNESRSKKRKSDHIDLVNLVAESKAEDDLRLLNRLSKHARLLEEPDDETSDQPGHNQEQPDNNYDADLGKLTI